MWVYGIVEFMLEMNVIRCGCGDLVVCLCDVGFSIVFVLFYSGDVEVSDVIICVFGIYCYMV